MISLRFISMPVRLLEWSPVGPRPGRRVAVGGAPDCRIAGLPDCRIAGLPDCRIAGLPDCRIAGLPDCRRRHDTVRYSTRSAGDKRPG
ncbi:MAG: hypothetical protein ACOY42_02205 [Pseudomonadota bacterium]